MDASAATVGGRVEGAPATGLLRIATAGSVDDGKSTLIGRLLYDSKQVLADQLEALQIASARRMGEGTIDLSLLTDGLRAEREQGITIDVAYRYFQTARRKFIIADTPGHEQYTRNMVTGASTADVALVLVDARQGVVEQTRRHVFVASLLRIPHLILCVNKMDLVGYDKSVFRRIVAELTAWATELEIGAIDSVPISALRGDNVVDPSGEMPWYEGASLLELLETLELAAAPSPGELRFPVQWVVRPSSDEHHDYRGYAGQIAAGVLRPEDEVLVLPSGRRARVAAIDTYDGARDVAFSPMSVTVRLADDVDVSRGDMLASPEGPPAVSRELEAMVCWMSEMPLQPGNRYVIRHTTREARAIVDALEARIDVNTLREAAADGLELNAIGRVRLRLSTPLMVDAYRESRATGSFILIDEARGDTVAAGMVLSAR